MPPPLRSARMRRILTAYTINRLGTWIGLVALLLAVFDHTHSALAVAGLLFAGQALPAFVVPAVVARVEASSRRGELSALYFVEAAATAALAVLLWHFWLPAVLLLVAIDGTAALAASALLRAEVARVAREDAAAAAPAAGAEDWEALGHLAERQANAALNVAFSATFVVGPVLGGVLVAVVGASAALFVDVGSFLVCGALLLDLHPHIEEAAGNSVGARLRVAWDHIRQTPSLTSLLVAEGFALVFFESAGPIEVEFAKATLNAGDRGFGLLLTSWGAGAVVGSVVFSSAMRRPLGRLISLGTLMVGLAYIGFAAAPSLPLACCAALFGGVGNGVELPSLMTIVQRLTPPALHGRMMGAVESLGSVAVAIGFPLGGALVALSSARVAFVVVGLGAVATALALLWIAPRALASANHREDAPAPAEDAPARPGATPARELEPPTAAAT